MARVRVARLGSSENMRRDVYRCLLTVSVTKEDVAG